MITALSKEAEMTAWIRDAVAGLGLLLFIGCSFVLADLASAVFAPI